MKTIIPNALIALSFIMIIEGCYSENIASRRIEKVHTLYATLVAKYCADAYPPIDATKDSVVLVSGQPLVIIDTFYAHDTLNNLTIKYIKEYRQKVDTLYRSKVVQVVNRANEKYLSDTNFKTAISLAKAQKTNKILLWITIILGIYTLARWILRIWSIRLP